MVRAVIAWSLHNRPIVLLGAVALVIAGVHAVLNLNVEAYPDPTPPLVEVITQLPEASPEEMERLVGIPIETALNGMPGLEDLRSTSVAGLTDIKCQWSRRPSGGSRTDENGFGLGYDHGYALHGPYAGDSLVLRARVSVW